MRARCTARDGVHMRISVHGQTLRTNRLGARIYAAESTSATYLAVVVGVVFSRCAASDCKCGGDNKRRPNFSLVINIIAIIDNEDARVNNNRATDSDAKSCVSIQSQRDICAASSRSQRRRN